MYRTFRVRLDISKTYAYQVTETYVTSDETADWEEVTAVGKDGDKRYVIYAHSI